MIAATGLAVAPIANAASAAIPSRIAAPVTNANYQDGDNEGGGSTAVILGVVLIVLIGIAAVSGGGDDSPASP
jgi:hypothetical protein